MTQDPQAPPGPALHVGFNDCAVHNLPITSTVMAWWVNGRSAIPAPRAQSSEHT